MKWLSILLMIFSVQAQATHIGNENIKKSDLTQFDLPLLIGDWYLLNQTPEAGGQDFIAIKLTLESDYTFQINIQKKDYSVEQWDGHFSADDDTLVLGSDSAQPQIYDYDSNHNILDLNGIRFTKVLPNTLAGVWSSESLAGHGLEANDIAKMDLVLQPNFIFLFKVISETGEQVVHKGVFYTEDDHLVLLYAEGEHDTTYILKNDKLTIESEGGDMFAVLNRIQ